VISPDINLSEGRFSIRYDQSRKSIIFALGAIKNVTAGFGQATCLEREKNGNFKSIIDFAERIDPKLINKRLLENIIKAGCFDSLHSNRNSLLHSVPKIMAYSSSYHKEKKSDQFSLISVETNSDVVLTEVADISVSERAYAEFDVLGLFLKNHPLSDLMGSLEQCNIKKSFDIKHTIPDGTSQHKISGVITKKDARMSQRGRFVTLLLSDPYGVLEVTIYNEEIFKNFANLINVKEPVVVYCDISKDKGGLRITANRFARIEEELSGLNYDISLYPANQRELEAISSVLNKKINKQKSNSNIILLLPAKGDFVAKVNLPSCFYLEESDIKQLKNNCAYLI
jgi:DNA polymerase-3 subunit alpha